jgi:predicted outer membrane repeat protein
MDNTAGSWGSGIADRNSIVTITNSRFLGNGTSFSAGGAIWDLDSSTRVTNCVFVRNQTFNQGGAIATEASQLSVFDSTFVQNGYGDYQAKHGGAIFADGSTVNVSNSILWNNFATQSAPEIGKTNGSTVKVTYTDYDGGHAGAGNINSRPRFMRAPNPGPDGIWSTTDDDFGDLRLRLASPCIDAGSNALVPAGTTTDIRGKARIVDVPGVNDPGAIVDMGAYERQVSTATNPPPSIVTGTVSANGVFSSGDLDDSVGDTLLDGILE